MIEYKMIEPPLDDYSKFFKAVGWTSSLFVSDEKLKSAIENTWRWVSAYDRDRLIGIGRLISDGALYALVCDMIVLPEYRKQGVGSLILKMLKDECRKHDIQRVWLFAARGQSEFYINNDFEIRPENAPGMQMITV